MRHQHSFWPIAAALVLALATTQGAADQLSDDFNACNSDNGQDAFRRCLEEAGLRENERHYQREAKRDLEAKAKAEKAKAARAAHIAKSKATAAARAVLVLEYQRVLKQLFPEYNFLGVLAMDTGHGFKLLGTHPMFSRYTFSVGPAGRRIQEWAGINRVRLISAYVSAVGVQSERGDSISFDLR